MTDQESTPATPPVPEAAGSQNPEEPGAATAAMPGWRPVAGGGGAAAPWPAEDAQPPGDAASEARQFEAERAAAAWDLRFGPWVRVQSGWIDALCRAAGRKYGVEPDDVRQNLLERLCRRKKLDFDRPDLPGYVARCCRWSAASLRKAVRDLPTDGDILERLAGVHEPHQGSLAEHLMGVWSWEQVVATFGLTPSLRELIQAYSRLRARALPGDPEPTHAELAGELGLREDAVRQRWCRLQRAVSWKAYFGLTEREWDVVVEQRRQTPDAVLVGRWGVTVHDVRATRRSAQAKIRRRLPGIFGDDDPA